MGLHKSETEKDKDRERQREQVIVCQCGKQTTFGVSILLQMWVLGWNSGHQVFQTSVFYLLRHLTSTDKMFLGWNLGKQDEKILG